jgi:2-dehydropantoate 2-reductase
LRIAVVGGGAIGCLFAARLRAAGNDVILVDRNSATVRRVREKGVKVQENDKTLLQVRVPVEGPEANLSDYELILFAVKAYDTEEAATHYAGRTGRRATILTLQNGLGNQEILSRIFGTGRVVVGSTTEGSLLKRPGFVAHTGKGMTLLGELDGSKSQRCLEIVEVFRRAGFNTFITLNSRGVVWAKTIVNSAINPISALTGLSNGELATIEGIRRMMLEVIREGIQVSKAMGISLEPRDPARELFQILRATARNRSSMLQDILKGRRTEVRELNGAIVKLAKKLRARTPYNTALTSLVLGLECSGTRPDTRRVR